MVGVLAGLIAVGFRWALAEAERARFSLFGALRQYPHAELWGWAVLPVFGLVVGSLSGWAVMRFAPDAPGSGIPHIKGVLLHVRSLNWRTLLPVKFVGASLCIGSGMSMGREGPTVQMGAAVGQAMADILRLPSRLTPQLISCGAGAGLAAAFNAPLAGFLFVIEELHREISARTFAGALVAALAADIVARALAGDLPSFAISGYPSIPLVALPAAVVIGAGIGLMGVLFNRCLLSWTAWAIGIKRIPRWMLPGLMAATCGAAAWWIPQAIGGGHSTAEQLLRGSLGWGILGLSVLLVLKFVFTVGSYASGAPGGIFAPMLLMGAVAGAIVGKAIAMAFPSLEPHATAFAILGMAAFFTGSVRAPLTGIVLIVEMTGNYQQLLALGVTCIVADLTAAAVRGMPIYEQLLEADLRRAPVKGKPELDTAEPRSVYIGIQRGSALEGKAIRASGLPQGCLIVAMERGGHEVLPEAEILLSAGDHLTVLIPSDEPEKAMLIVRLATGL